MNLVVTGAESFIGRTLVPLLLQRGHRVVGIDAAPPSFAGGVAVDIRSPELIDSLPEGADAIVHLAAVSREPDCAGDPRLAFDVNVTGTANVIASARRRNVKQVVFASSEWVYGDVANDAVQDEDTLIDPRGVRNEYAASKLAGEMALNVAVRRGLAAGTVLRFGIIYGPRPNNWSAVEALLNNVMTKDEVTVGSLATARRFIHVRDIAAGIAAAIGRSDFEIFNLAGPQLVPLRQIIDLSCEVSHKRPRITEREPAAVSIRNPISTRAERTLSWKPEVGIGDGLAEIAAYFDAAAKDRSRI
jgi:nucleoside-diphosphate-sugar epimerase